MGSFWVFLDLVPSRLRHFVLRRVRGSPACAAIPGFRTDRLGTELAGGRGDLAIFTATTFSGRQTPEAIEGHEWKKGDELGILVRDNGSRDEQGSRGAVEKRSPVEQETQEDERSFLISCRECEKEE